MLKNSYLVLLKTKQNTQNNYWFGVSFFSLSFRSVCSLFTFGRSSPEMQDEIPPSVVEIAPDSYDTEKDNSITYSWDHTGSQAVN